MSCFVKAATRTGGTERGAVGGRRTEVSERRRRTVVVWMLTLGFVCDGDDDIRHDAIRLGCLCIVRRQFRSCDCRCIVAEY